MKKSIAKNLLIVIAEIAYLALAGALSSCHNPFLQLGSQAISQAASPGIVSAVIVPEPRLMTVNFQLPETDEVFYTQQVPAGSEIDWDAVYEEYNAHIDKAYLDNYGWSFRHTIVKEWQDPANSAVYSGSRPAIDVRYETINGETELYLMPELRYQWIFIFFDGGLGSPYSTGLAPRYTEGVEYVPSIMIDMNRIDCSIPWPVEYENGKYHTTFDYYHPEELFFELDQFYDYYSGDPYVKIMIPCDPIL